MKSRKGKRLLQRMPGLMLVILLLAGCGGVQAEPTATPTNEPTPTTPEPFAIQDIVFDAEYESHKVDCTHEVDVEIHLAENGELYFLFGGEMWIPLRGTDFVLWCYGAEHTWIGEATYAGYTFASEKKNPLRFRVDENAGYLYVSGEGTVTMPDGTRVTLPSVSFLRILMIAVLS